jgi:hypothetical protein
MGASSSGLDNYSFSGMKSHLLSELNNPRHAILAASSRSPDRADVPRELARDADRILPGDGDMQAKMS